MSTSLPADLRILSGIFAVSGAVHLATPGTCEPLMPAFVPAHREVIYASGVAELLCAAGLLNPVTRRSAGWASAALLVGVYPGNLKMAADARRGVRRPLPGARPAAGRHCSWPLIRSALKAARGRRGM